MNSDCKNRIEGLVLLDEIDKFNKSVHAITVDLIDEGFERDEIEEMLIMKIKWITSSVC
jgi:ATP-dependent protease HslVU (ClpYQ) ATPase subunit